MNTFYFIIQQTMFFAIPLLIVGLGGLYSERSGVSNIGLEGIMIIGAFTGVVSINLLDEVFKGQMLFVVSIIIAGLFGLLYALLHAWASIKLKADQTISGTALNLFAPAFCIFLARSIGGTKQISFKDTFMIDKVPVLGDIPFIGQCFFTNTYISTYIGIIILVVLAILIDKTRFGLRFCACGENPDSAASVGISVTGMRFKGVAISGVLAGMGGIIFVVPTSTEFAGSVSGYGFLALAVLIMGQWKPVGILIASVFFGLLKAFSSTYSGIPVLANLNIPSEVYKMIPYVLTIVVLAISSERSNAPKSLGKPYDDGAGFLESIKKKKINITLITIMAAVFIVLTLLFAFRDGAKVRNKDVSPGYGAELALCITSGSSVDDKSFCEGEWEGIIKASDKCGITRKYYQGLDASQEATAKTMEIAIRGGAGLVVAATADFDTAVYDIQERYPDQHIMLVDAVPKSSKTGETKIGKNTICLSVAEQQAGFLAGYAAVMDGYRDLGFVGGVALPAVKRYGYGFTAGAEYAARKLGLKKNDVNIKYTYSGTFNPSPEILAMASSWYRSGTEVIFSCGGGICSSIMKAAETNGGKVIGVDSDQSDESETVITSAIKQTGPAISEIIEKAYLEGEMLIKGGETKTLTAADEAVKLPMETSKFRKFTPEQYIEIYKELADGVISIPDDTSAENVGDIPLSLVGMTEIN